MNQIQIIEVPAGEVSAELKRRGIGSDERVTLTIEAEQEIAPGRRTSRVSIGAGCSPLIGAQSGPLLPMV